MAEYIERGGDRFPTSFRSEEKGDYRQGWNHCLRAIYQMPAADVVEVQHGRWELGGMFGDIGRCSNCHYMFPADTAMSEFHYCPNCGADMRNGGQDE